MSGEIPNNGAGLEEGSSSVAEGSNPLESDLSTETGEGGSSSEAPPANHLPISGEMRADIDLYIPPKGGDGISPVVVDRRMPLSEAAPKRGPAHLALNLNISDGSLLIPNQKLATIFGLRFTDREWPYLPTYLPNTLRANAEGVLQMVGDLREPDGSRFGLSNLAGIFKTQDLPLSFPIGLREGAIACVPAGATDYPLVLTARAYEMGFIDTPLPHFAGLISGFPDLDFEKVKDLAYESRLLGGRTCLHPQVDMNPPLDPTSFLTGLDLSAALYLEDDLYLSEDPRFHPEITAIRDGETYVDLSASVEREGQTLKTAYGLDSQVNLDSLAVGPHQTGPIHGRLASTGTLQVKPNPSFFDSSSPSQPIVSVRFNTDHTFELDDLSLPEQQVELSIQEATLQASGDVTLHEVEDKPYIDGMIEMRGDVENARVALGGHSLVSIDHASLEAQVDLAGPTQSPDLAAQAQFTVSGQAVLGEEITGAKMLGTSAAVFSAAGSISVQDSGFSTPEGEVRERSIVLTDLDLDLSAETDKGFGLTGSIRPGQRTSTLNGRSVEPGIRFTSDLIGATFGATATLEFNLRVSDTRLSGPMGGLPVRANLLGTIDLVNISGDATRPDWRPVVGSINLKLSEISLNGSMLSEGSISIHDNVDGVLTGEGRQKLPLGEIPLVGAQIEEWLGGTVASQLFKIEVNDDALVPFALPEGPTNIACSSDSPRVRYYEASQINAIGIPTFIAKIGDLAVQASARLAKSASGQWAVKEVKGKTLPFGQRQMTFKNSKLVTDGGGVQFWANERRVRTVVTVPQKIEIDAEGPEGMRIKGELTAEMVLDSTFNLKKENLSFRKGEPLRVMGQLTLMTADGKTFGPINVDQNTFFKASGYLRKDRGLLGFNLEIPEFALSLDLPQALRLRPDITLEAGTRLDLWVRGFKTKVKVNFSNLTNVRTEARMSSSDVRVSLNIPGSPLENLGLLPLSGPIALRIQNKNTDQEYRLSFSPRDGARFETIPPNKMQEWKMTLDIGSDLSIAASSGSSAESVTVVYLPDTGDFKLDIDALVLVSKTKGFVDLSRLKILLGNAQLDALLGDLSVALNPKTGRIKLTIGTPSSPLLKVPPTDYKEWLNWTAEDWYQYRFSMDTLRHALVLSEDNAKLPGSPFPPGKGKIYIDLPDFDRETNFKTNFQGDAVAAINWLIRELLKTAEMRREFPNPPSASGAVRETVIYHEPQDAIFFLDPTDTELMETIEEALGVGPEEARRYFQNGRLDLEDLLKAPWIKENLPQTVLRALMHAFLDEDPGDAYFTRKGHRFLMALSDMRQGILGNAKMTKFHKTWWSPHVRYVIPRDFSEPAYRGAMSEKSDGLNMTFSAFLPFPLKDVASVIGDVPNYRYWATDFTDTRRTRDGAFSGALKGNGKKYKFNVAVREKDYGPVKTILISEKGPSGRFESLAVRYLLVPINGGTLLIQLHARDMEGDDKPFYKGRDEDINELQKWKYLFSIKGIGHRFIRWLRPNVQPKEVFRYHVNRSVSRLYDMLYHGRPPQALDYSDFDAEADQLRYAPDGIVYTSPAQEFMSFVREAPNAKAHLSISPDPRDRQRVLKLLEEELGLDEGLALRIVDETHQLTLEDLAQVDFIKDNLESDTLANLIIFYLEKLDPAIQSRGERLLLFLGDMRRRLDAWRDAKGKGKRAVDFRAFLKDRFHIWSPHNNVNPADGVDGMLMGHYPPEVSLEAILRVFSDPERFQETVAEFKETRPVECNPPAEGFKCTYWVINVKIDTARSIMKAPDTLQYVGNVGYAPWWWQASEDPGFEENVGSWVLIPLKNNGGTIVSRIGLINSKLTGDFDFRNSAFEGLPPFVAAIYRKARERANIKGSDIKMVYGEGYETKE